MSGNITVAMVMAIPPAVGVFTLRICLGDIKRPFLLLWRLPFTIIFLMTAIKRAVVSNKRSLPGCFVGAKR